MKKNYLLLTITAIVAITAIAILLVFTKPAEVLSNRFEFEYGQPVDIYNLQILDNADYSLIGSNFKNEDGKDYPEVGEYGLTFSYKRLFKSYIVDVLIVVKDTTVPVFDKTCNELTLNKGTTGIDFENFFHASDSSEVSYEFIVEKVDFNKTGTYDATVIAKDASYNESRFDFEIIINDLDDSKSEDIQITYIDGLIIANKKHPLPEDYNPGENEEAAKAIKELIEDAKELNLAISDSYSGFRSYSTQSSIYNSYVARDGKNKADRYSARPGYSEHQTGFAFDLRSPSGRLLETEKEVTWVAENAYKYGFIVRYLQDKEEITGYMYEPWHLRYVGDKALDIYKSGLSLEEYYGFEGGTEY